MRYGDGIIYVGWWVSLQYLEQITQKNVSGMGNNSIAFEFTGETLHNGDINCNVQMQLHEDTN